MGFERTVDQELIEQCKKKDGDRVERTKKKMGFERTVDQELIEECKKKDGG